MATEARRNGGRNEPLVDDNWRGGKKHPKRKPFGLRVTYEYTYSLYGGGQKRRKYTWTQWYATQRARDDAEKAFLAGRGGFALASRTCEKVEK